MNNNEAYSNLKILHHPERMEALRNQELMAPLRIQLIPTNRCNQRCSGCAYRLDGYTTSQIFNDNHELSWEKLSEIINDCQNIGVKAIEITGGGEPSVHPQFLRLCKMILDAGIDLGLVTNGVRWSPEHTEVLSNASWVRFSIDAGNSSTYAAYRRSSRTTYDRVRQNLQSLASSKGKSDLLVGVGFVVTRDNWGEIVDAVRFARKDGADNIRISALFQNDGASYFDGVYDAILAACAEASSMTTDDFKVFNQFSNRLSDMETAQPHYTFCGYTKLTTYLGADYNAYACCNTAYSPQGILGSFKNCSFRELWEKQETTQRLWSINASKCPRCMYNTKNEVINYLLSHTPKHVNFI